MKIVQIIILIFRQIYKLILKNLARQVWNLDPYKIYLKNKRHLNQYKILEKLT